MTSPRCAYRLCDALPTLRISPQYSSDFLACSEHGPPWAATLSEFDNRSTVGTSVVELYSEYEREQLTRECPACQAPAGRWCIAASSSEYSSTASPIRHLHTAR